MKPDETESAADGIGRGRTVDGASSPGQGEADMPGAGPAEPADRTTRPPPRHKAPEWIGQYRVIERTAAGGMGEVFKAEQRHPIQRIVAVKLIKLGMDSERVIARFEAERQALAMMDHPGIARVFDAGLSDAGRPYFAMEFVQGEPITLFCNRHSLSVRQRLELFMVVCDAVQHAHQKGIIHRDLKPSNILVSEGDGKPMPKVIDFGVAKAISHRLTERTLFTESGQLVGTPEYMSPEQAEMGLMGIDTRSDIYSLGVLLYELLTGCLPFDAATLRQAAYGEIQRIIRELDPPHPSTRLSSLDAGTAARIVAERRTQLPELSAELRRELAWIPLRAMRKDRTERYATAKEMGEDIGRYLTQQPLLAAPPSKVYRVRKFIRRNKGTVMAAAAVVGALLLGIVGTTAFALYARQQASLAKAAESRAVARQEEAERQRETAEQTKQFVIDLFEGANPDHAQGREVTAVELVREGVNSLESDLDPLVKAQLQQTLGEVLYSLGKYAEAESLLRQALSQREAALGPDHLDTLATLVKLGLALENQDRYVDAEPLYARVLKTRELRLGPDDPATLAALNEVAMNLVKQGRSAEAEPLLRRSLESRQRKLGPDHRDTLEAASNLALTLDNLGRYTEAEPLVRRALEGMERLHGPDHTDTIKIVGNLANNLSHQGRDQEAVNLFRRAAEANGRVLGPDHLLTLDSIGNLATALSGVGERDEADRLFREVLEDMERELGADHHTTINTVANFAYLMQMSGRTPEAEPLFRRVVEGQERTLGPKHPSTLVSLHNLAAVWRSMDRVHESEELFQRSLKGLDEVLGPEHPFTSNCASNLAFTLDLLDRKDDAAAVRKAYGLRLPETQPTTQPATRPPTQPAGVPA
jgi:non-specific serine/threonine protein kinase/serine/threonine-protein kinase